MPKLTPLGQNLVRGFAAITIISVLGVGGWYAYTELSADEGGSSGDNTTNTASNSNSGTSPTTNADAGDQGGGGILSGIFGGSSSPPCGLGECASNPLTVSIVSWHGYVGGLYANGGLLTQPGSINANNGLYVEYTLDDGIPTMLERFEPNEAQCMWRTIDFWAQEQPALRGAGLDGRMVMVVDNSRGGDAIIGRSGTIESVEDLAGKQVAITEFTPSHMLAIYARDNSSMSRRGRESVQFRPFGSNADGLAAFKAGQVDALVTWEPETSLALTTVPGAKRVFDTSQATSLIYDGMVCNTQTIDSNPDVIQRFVSGWMEGAKQANANPRKGAEVLVASEAMFAALVQDQGMDFLVGNVFGGIRWTTLEDNIRVFGLAGNSNTFERIYTESDTIWRENTNLLDGMPVVNFNDGYDIRFIEALMDATPQARTAAQTPEFTFTSTERDAVVKRGEAALTKSLQINFATGKADLNERGKQTLDEVVSLLDATSGAYVQLSGNTDSTGSRAVNQRLSTARANAAAEYLINEWEIPADRLAVVGNGSDKPLCNESDPVGSGYEDLDDCRAANRTTRITILGN